MKKRKASTPRSDDASLPSIGRPGEYDVMASLLDGLCQLVAPEMTPIMHLEQHPDAIDTVRKLIYKGMVADAPRSEEYVNRLDEFLAGGVRRIRGRIDFLKTLSAKQRRGRERAALLHPGGQQRLDFDLLRALTFVATEACVVRPKRGLRDDCLVCYGTFLSDARKQKKCQWWRHHTCGAWVCGVCFDRIRKMKATAQCCPKCRGSLDAGRVTSWYGQVRVFAPEPARPDLP